MDATKKHVDENFHNFTRIPGNSTEVSDEMHLRRSCDLKHKSWFSFKYQVMGRRLH
jgi:hypothetical protein